MRMPNVRLDASPHQCAALAGRSAAGQALLGAVADAEACSAAVNGLSKLATDRAAAAKTERAAARKAAGRLQQRADRTLATAPAVPGDMCKSMQRLGAALRARCK